MQVGDWIAGYAAVVATSAFAWQWLTYWHAHVVKLTLSIEPAVIVLSCKGWGPLYEAFDGRTEYPEDVEWFFNLRISNRGLGRIQITSIRISQDTATGTLGWDAARRASLPLWLKPGEERSFRFTDDDLDGCTLTGELDVRVSTSRGKEFRYARRLLNSDTVAISSFSLFKDLTDRAGLTDSIYRFEVHELEETPVIKRGPHRPHDIGDESPPSSS
jgi:hypothetical protein